MDIPKLVDDLGLNPEEMILFKAILKFDNVNEDMIRENFAIYRKFKEWEKKHPDAYPLLKKVNPAWADTYWFAIQWWWDEYCEKRKKFASPNGEQLFAELRNCKP